MPKSSRWMGTRYAMVRYAEDSDIIKLRKIRAEFNVADIVTKCLVGAAFVTNRARILGLPYQAAYDEVIIEDAATANSEDTAAAEKPPRPNKSETPTHGEHGGSRRRPPRGARETPNRRAGRGL